MINRHHLTLRPLEAADAAVVSKFISAQPPAYTRFFYAFGGTAAAISEMLSACREDVYTGVFWQGEMAGLFMLRGWDAGYEIPSFGIMVAEKFRGGDFLRLCLDAAKLTCRLSGAKRMMAKVHPDNCPPRGLKRLNFYQTGFEEATGNNIYHLDL